MLQIRLIFALAALSIFPLGAVYSQSNQKPVLPPGPLVAEIPNTGTFSVTYTYRPETLGQAGVLESLANNSRSLMSESDGRTSHILLTRIGGNVQTVWKAGGSAFIQVGPNAVWYTIAPNSNLSDLMSAKFPGLDWVGADNFVGITKYRDADCLLFMRGDTSEIDVNDETAINNKIEHAFYMALIDLKTRLPVQVTYAGTKEVFQYGPPPAKLSLPKSLVDQLAQSSGRPH